MFEYKLYKHTHHPAPSGVCRIFYWKNTFTPCSQVAHSAKKTNSESRLAPHDTLFFFHLSLRDFFTEKGIYSISGLSQLPS